MIRNSYFLRLVFIFLAPFIFVNCEPDSIDEENNSFENRQEYKWEIISIDRDKVESPATNK